jgi:hypothetical protein
VTGRFARSEWTRRRLLPLTLLALLGAIPPAAADEANEFFALFDRTCAKSLSNQQAFVDAAKAAGAAFKFALSGRPEAEMAQAWGDTSYWVMDDRPRGPTLSMTAIGSDAKHSLCCIVYAPPRSNVTLDGAITPIRAMMGLGEPTDRHEAGPARSSGASWLVGPAMDQQRIGADIASADSDAASSIAVITSAGTAAASVSGRGRVQGGVR